MSTSLRTIDPFSGFSRPTSDLRKTDLPVPDGPSITEISPGGSVRVTSLQMFWLPNDFVSPSTSTATPTSRPSAPASLPACAHHDQQAPAVSWVWVVPASGRPRSASLPVSNESAVDRLRVSRGFRDGRLPLARPGETEVHLTGRTPQGPTHGVDRPLRTRVVRFPGLRPGTRSLDRDGGAGALEGGLGLLGGVLGDLLQDRLRRAVDQVLGLLEAERGQAAHLLDDLDLLVAGALEDDVELVLLLGSSAGVATATGGRGGRDGDRGSSGDLEGLLELLHEVGQLEQRHLLERVE